MILKSATAAIGNGGAGRQHAPLRPKGASGSEWGAAAFCQPKKTGDIRVLTDFRELHKRLKRKPFPLPRIN